MISREPPVFKSGFDIERAACEGCGKQCVSSNKHSSRCHVRKVCGWKFLRYSHCKQQSVLMRIPRVMDLHLNYQSGTFARFTSSTLQYSTGIDYTFSILQYTGTLPVYHQYTSAWYRTTMYRWCFL